MNINQELLKLMQQNNVTIEQLAQQLFINSKTLKKRFETQKLRYDDVKKILDILGYKMVFRKSNIS